MEKHIQDILPHLDEKQARIFLASCANQIGHGGVKKVHEISGFSQTTIIKGKHELESDTIESNRIRRSGGGRKKLEETHPLLPKWIESMVADETYGNPENPLVWTTKAVRKIQAAILLEHDVSVAHRSIATQLQKLGYSLQSNRKMLQIGESHPDRNKQFEYINDTAKEFIAAGEPVISVDTKKKEMIGNYANNGEEYRPVKTPLKVYDHDYPDGELIKVAPYGIYVQNDNTAFVNLGTSHDTSEFAVESISRWWNIVGKNTYPNATKLYITCDCGGSNSYRTRMWKYQLQQFANRTGLEVNVSHFPPGTSKWNKIEHRLFCYISKNWRGKPLVDIDTVISLISNTTTTKGLSVICKRDDNYYPLKQKPSDEEFGTVIVIKIGAHGEWNYKFLPQ
jgi:transposase